MYVAIKWNKIVKIYVKSYCLLIFYFIYEEYLWSKHRFDIKKIQGYYLNNYLDIQGTCIIRSTIFHSNKNMLPYMLTISALSFWRRHRSRRADHRSASSSDSQWEPSQSYKGIITLCPVIWRVENLGMVNYVWMSVIVKEKQSLYWACNAFCSLCKLSLHASVFTVTSRKTDTPYLS